MGKLLLKLPFEGGFDGDAGAVLEVMEVMEVVEEVVEDIEGKQPETKPSSDPGD